MKENDPTIDRIRQVRHEISAEFGHDPKRLIAYYARLEKDLPDCLLEERPEKQESSELRK
jgi:hypothetical protein